MKNKKRGVVVIIILIVIGLILSLTALGFFRTEHSGATFLSFSYKSILKVPCGILVNRPKHNETVEFPITIKGYINGCGWENIGDSAGNVILYAEQGFPLTPSVKLYLPSQENRTPYTFEAKINLALPATVERGILIFENNRGGGLEPLTFELPINFK